MKGWLYVLIIAVVGAALMFAWLNSKYNGQLKVKGPDAPKPATPPPAAKPATEPKG